MPTPIPNVWQMQSQGDADSLIEALRHSDPGVRRRAAAALRAIGAWHAVPALEGALVNENDWQAHAAMTAAVQYLDRDIHIEQMVKNKDLRGLSKMLSSSRIEDMLTASAALGALGDRRAVEPLIILFRNPLVPAKARLAAAEALLKLESAPAVVTLLGALRRDDWQIRRNAAAVLGQLQASWAVEPLIGALTDAMPIVRKTAAAALRRIGTPDAVTAAQKFEDANRKSATHPLPSLPESLQASLNQSASAAPLEIAMPNPLPSVTPPPTPADATSAPTIQNQNVPPEPPAPETDAAVLETPNTVTVAPAPAAASDAATPAVDPLPTPNSPNPDATPPAPLKE